MSESSQVADARIPGPGRDDDANLEALDSARTKLVALCLARERSATLAELHEDLGEPRCSLLRILGDLIEEGLVERVEGTYHFRGEEDVVPGASGA